MAARADATLLLNIIFSLNVVRPGVTRRTCGSTGGIVD
jgi:hypothetical protein